VAPREYRPRSRSVLAESCRGRAAMTNAAGLLALLCLSVPVLVASGVADSPMDCALDMSNLVEVISTAAADITFSTADCTPPTLDELDCSADIVDAIHKLTSVATTISSATITCGGMHSECATSVSATIEDTLDVGGQLIAAAADCAAAPFNCVVDVFEAINSIMSVAVDIYSALADCNPAPVNEYNAEPDMSDQASYDAAVQSLGLDPLDLEGADPGGPPERRLVGERPLQVLGQTSPSQPEGWKHHVQSAREEIARLRDHFTSLGIETEATKVAGLRGVIEAQAQRPRGAAAPPVAVEANDAVGRRPRQVLNSTASLAAAGTGFFALV